MRATQIRVFPRAGSSGELPRKVHFDETISQSFRRRDYQVGGRVSRSIEGRNGRGEQAGKQTGCRGRAV